MSRHCGGLLCRRNHRHALGLKGKTSSEQNVELKSGKDILMKMLGTVLQSRVSKGALPQYQDEPLAGLRNRIIEQVSHGRILPGRAHLLQEVFLDGRPVLGLVKSAKSSSSCHAKENGATHSTILMDFPSVLSSLMIPFARLQYGQ